MGVTVYLPLMTEIHYWKKLRCLITNSCPTLWPHGLQHARPPCPSHRWCHPTISSSVVPFSHLQSFPASGSFAMSQLFASGGQSIRASASVLQHSAFFIVQLSHPYMTTGKSIALTRQIFVGKVMSLLSNTLSRLVTAFLLRRTRLLISWLQSPSALILEPPKIKSATVSPSISYEVMGPDAIILGSAIL